MAIFLVLLAIPAAIDSPAKPGYTTGISRRDGHDQKARAGALDRCNDRGGP